MGTKNRRATDINTVLVHWPLMGGYYIWYSKDGPGQAAALPSPLLAVPNITGHASTAYHSYNSYHSMWHYN